jgi:hypothetical protein
MPYTTIQINKLTRSRLQDFKVSKRETYDEILNALMDLIPSGDDEGEYTEEFKASIIKGMLDIKHGRTYTLEQVEERLGLI